MNFARLLSEGSVTENLRLPEGDAFRALPKGYFQPLGFTFRESDGRLSPTYPMGLPLLLSVGGVCESEFGMRMVYALVALLACLGLWLLGKELGLAPPWRFYAVAIFASSPLFLWSSLIPMSDALASCQAIWVLLLALQAKRSSGWACVCGFLVGWAVLTRPSSVLLFVPLVVALLQAKAGWRRWAWGTLGGMPAFVAFLWGNWTFYGDAFGSGYGDLWAFFSWDYLVPTVFHYGETMLFAMFGLVLPAAFLGSLNLRCPKVLFLWAWILPFFGFYAFYVFTSQTWWFLRFVLLAFPGLALLSANWLEGVATRAAKSSRGEAWLALGLAGASVAVGCYWVDKLNVFGEQAFERRYEIECQWAVENLAADTIVVCMQSSGAFYYYTEFPVFRWDLADWDADWELLRDAALVEGVPVVAVLHDFEVKREDSILRRYADRWELLGPVAERVSAYRLR
ncbi:glycosyltransferase family 39 protein [Pelagicoccus sp. NFK12]|uniref:Glycosyltransferase family 39 protein n=1 Tax=Pelagicoccus enzymogenes TaxID=2773457 RepID=A0A927F7I8_9BACT|nr:glycosyltransferase family 39 protein [Pelagicoccus enzymogenes]MBD5778383.1 glycosyltransferase family 39 protein [Pelagicoccus enzymogenes]